MVVRGGGGVGCLHYWLVERSAPVRLSDRAGGGPVSVNWHHLSDLLLFLSVLFCFFLRLLLGLTCLDWAKLGRAMLSCSGKTERPSDCKCN